MTDYIILVDENDMEIGFESKMAAHIKGFLHRAFSIFVYNSQKKVLLHKRAAEKYHSGGLWSNTCCSHPRYGEALDDAIHRRLVEEMGFDCNLKEIFSFKYRIELDKSLIEYEYDHVFIGEYNGEPDPDPHEIDEFAWIAPEEIVKDIRENPDKYSYWFKLSVKKVIEHISSL